MSSIYPHASYYGNSAFVKKGEPLGKNYFDNPTRDYHGGYARQHHAEMRQIALQTVQEVAPKLVDEICTTIWGANRLAWLVFGTVWLLMRLPESSSRIKTASRS